MADVVVGLDVGTSGVKGIALSPDGELVGRPRFMCRDPFGNLIEFARIDDPSA